MDMENNMAARVLL